MIKYLWKKWIHYYNTDIKLYNLFWNIIRFPKDFYLFIREFCFFIKNGYPYEAVYNHFNYISNHISKILEEYLSYHHGYPYDITNEEWENIINTLIYLLEQIDEDRYDETNEWDMQKETALSYETEKWNYLKKNSKEFFELYNKYFFSLWD